MPPSTTGSLSSLRERNRSEVVDVLRRRGHASRADIARETGLSRTTVSSLVADLSSRILAEDVVAVDVDHSADGALDAAADLARGLLDGLGVDLARIVAVGMGLPGPIDRETGVIGSSVILPAWSGRRPAAELGERLAHDVRVDNDANLGALGELTYGAGAGAQDMVYVKVASGVGAGLVLGGRLHRGSTGIAGEIGHVMVIPDGEVCRCGNRGCLETVAAAPALLELLGRSRDEELTVESMLALAAGGDPGARRVLTDAGRAIGRALADLCNCLNPERVIVGGELGAAGAPLLEGIRESIQRWALPAAAEATEVVAGVLGARAELLGSLALVISDTNRFSSAMLAPQ